MNQYRTGGKAKIMHTQYFYPKGNREPIQTNWGLAVINSTDLTWEWDSRYDKLNQYSNVRVHKNWKQSVNSDNWVLITSI